MLLFAYWLLRTVSSMLLVYIPEFKDNFLGTGGIELHISLLKEEMLHFCYDSWLDRLFGLFRRSISFPWPLGSYIRAHFKTYFCHIWSYVMPSTSNSYRILGIKFLWTVNWPIIGQKSECHSDDSKSLF